MKRPYFARHNQGPIVRVNGRIRAREVRVVAGEGRQLGVLPLGEAINLARSQGVDLVEVAPNASPPVCRLVDYGKYRYEQSKKEKEHKKHQHANKVKEVQLRPSIDPHDFSTKLSRAIDFLCEDMKVKATLRFRGREMAHQEFGFQVVENFIKELEPFGHPDAPIRKIGRGINVMLSPHPRNKRAKNPNLGPKATEEPDSGGADSGPTEESETAHAEDSNHVATDAAEKPSNFGENPFSKLDDADLPKQ